MRKTILAIIVTFLVSVSLFAQTGQIVNNGFNSWSANGYNPIGWTTIVAALPVALAGTSYATIL